MGRRVEGEFAFDDLAVCGPGHLNRSDRMSAGRETQAARRGQFPQARVVCRDGDAFGLDAPCGDALASGGRRDGGTC